MDDRFAPTTTSQRCDFRVKSVRRWASVLLLYALVLALPQHRIAVAQGGAKISATLKGELVDVNRRGVTFKTDDGKTVAASYPQNRYSIRYLANAKPAWLRPGMFVRVEAKFNAAGTPTAPIDKLFVVEPYKETQSSRKSKVVPGIHALDRKPAGNRNQAAAPMATARYSVVGRFTAAQGNVIVLNPGKQLVRIPVTDNAKLQIEFNSFSLAKPGDPIEVKGFINPPNETEIISSTITVRSTKIYGEAPPKDENKEKEEKKNDAEEK
ncbi:MAG: hypothetical protein AAFP90_05930 [Planctomycetota bacterium]